jgi:hypothetical protein
MNNKNTRGDYGKTSIREVYSMVMRVWIYEAAELKVEIISIEIERKETAARKQHQ